MKTKEELKNYLKKLEASYGDKYLFFIAPYNMSLWNKYKIIESYVFNKISPDISIFEPDTQLDVFYIEQKKIIRGNNLIIPRISMSDIFNSNK